MNRHLYFLFALLFVSACTTPNPDHSSPVSPKRTVINNRLISQHLPNIEIEIDETMPYRGRFDFTIKAMSDEYPAEIRGQVIAAGERFVFAEANAAGEIDKMLIVQLEGFLPNNNFIYRYDFSQAAFIGKNKYRHNIWFHNNKQSAQNNPSGESAKTRAFIAKKGLTVEDEYMLSRYVGLASADRKNEIIIFYIEMLNKTTGYSLHAFENTLDTTTQNPIQKAFIERGRQQFQILNSEKLDY